MLHKTKLALVVGQVHTSERTPSLQPQNYIGLRKVDCIEP